MSKKCPPAWHSQVRLLRAKGLCVAEIANRVERSTCMIKWVLDENGERQATRERAKASKQMRASFNARHATDKIAPRAPAKTLRAINSASVMDAARAFAKGKIDRAELMRRITPDRDRRQSAITGAL